MASATSQKCEQYKKEMEEIRAAFRRLVDAIPEEDWDRLPPGEEWTPKQVLVHVTQVLGVLPAGIEQAVRQRRRSVLSFLPTKLRSWVNGHVIIPVLSRNATRESIAESYGKAHGKMIRLLEQLPEDAWSKGANYPGRFRTVEQMAHRPAEHFREHAAHLQEVLGIKP